MKKRTLSYLLILLLFSPALFAQKATPKKLAVTQLEQILKQKANVNQGEAKFTVPQHDMGVTVDDFKIIPPMGIGSWVAFSPTPKGAMLMDDIVIQENEIGPVQRVVLENGLSITATHNQFMRDKPKIMYMHIGGWVPRSSLPRG